MLLTKLKPVESARRSIPKANLAFEAGINSLQRDFVDIKQDAQIRHHLQQVLELIPIKRMHVLEDLKYMLQTLVGYMSTAVQSIEPVPLLLLVLLIYPVICDGEK